MGGGFYNTQYSGGKAESKPTSLALNENFDRNDRKHNYLILPNRQILSLQ